ncbi:MAG: hypothetical protein FJZ47_02295 [Candidatus Tectomicrobia bacterium]|uniref:Uncharacterized protein n=1 Tax=Tectimicrobiota bacterium TaxID=2528274 RepID=A0A937VY07_UNCTE|nr:hypothetical protein [Candidatus Tectomicrobia bacterium]
MIAVSTEDPQCQSAIHTCAVALRRLAQFELDTLLQQRLHDLGARKELLTPAEHAELLALVAFAQQRTIEKLEAQAALHRLRTVLPESITDA